ncbi:unnamed protein product [Microthlaspi erraticum]|uniref:Uncharacterized protein n=1 Tax=Microthlaspi erraticum TaxID=1685480 RepID=A0A6D2J6M7_9BRAS|nr:unnamed protein product [Microthlaspi erraticum]
MERDLAITSRRRPAYSTGRCLNLPSSCLSLIHAETEYARISDHNNKKTSSSPRLRTLLRRLLLVRSYGSVNTKPKTFHYDAVSYSQNFDDGFSLRDDDRRVFRDLQRQSRDQ